jgi:hypothetical protein
MEPLPPIAPDRLIRERLCRYATERRGPWMRFTDKMARNYDFDG